MTTENQISSALQKVSLIEDNLAFMNALVAVGPPHRSATGNEFALVPKGKRELILARALWLKLQVGDIRDFLEEPVCGGYVEELRCFLERIGALRAAQFISDVEALFPSSCVPKNEDDRHSLLISLDRCQPDLLNRLTEAYLNEGENLVGFLRRYVNQNADELAQELLYG